MNVGDCYSTHPLIWATRPLAFLVGLVIMTIIEEAVVGLHYRSIATSLGELAGHRLNEPIAGILIMSLVLVPYFAVRVLGETLSAAIHYYGEVFGGLGLCREARRGLSLVRST